MKSTGYCRLCGKIKEHFCCQTCYEQDATKSTTKQELGKRIVQLEQELADAQAKIEELKRILKYDLP